MPRAGRRAATSLELLDALGLSGRERSLPGTLSGGEQQRVAIARAVANHPDLLLADEPTGALDSESAALVLDLLRARHDRGQTIVMVTHDPDVAAAADRIVHVLDGRIVAAGQRWRRRVRHERAGSGVLVGVGLRGRRRAGWSRPSPCWCWPRLRSSPGSW